MSSELTNEQGTELYEAVFGGEGVVNPAYAEWARALREELHSMGWTIEPPAPRFTVHQCEKSDRVVYVKDTGRAGEGVYVRYFYVDPDVESYHNTVAAAQAEANRLNRKAQR